MRTACDLIDVSQTADDCSRFLFEHEMSEWAKQKDIIREILGSGPAIDFADDVSAVRQFALIHLPRRPSWRRN